MSAQDHLSPSQFIYRGMPMFPQEGDEKVRATPEEVYDNLRDPYTRTLTDKGTRALGTHWTKSLSIARSAATIRPGWYAGAMVVLHATHPGPEHVMNPRAQERHAVDHPDGFEQETPIEKRAPMRVHGVDIAVRHGPYTGPYQHHDVDWRLPA